MHREFREASDLRASALTFGFVMLSAALLRGWNLTSGPVTAGETGIIEPVVELLRTGVYHPSALTQPTLPIYLQAAVAIAHFLLGATLGAWRTIGEFDASHVLAWGRACSAVLGTGAVLVVYHIGVRWGARHGLLAAGLMAVMPMHVAASREIGYGAPLTFFAALTLLLSLRASERGTRRAFLAAGAAAGLTAACHYAGAITILVPLIAVWMTRTEDSSRASRAAAVLGSALAGFVAATPLSVRDLPAFLNGYAQAAAPLAGAAASIDLVEQLRWAMQWPGILLALGGLILAIVRAITGPGHIRWTLIGSFPIVYLSLVAWHGATSGAIVLPTLPAIAVLAAVAVVSGVSQLRRFEIPRAARTALIAALTIAAVLPPAVFSIELVARR